VKLIRPVSFLVVLIAISLCGFAQNTSPKLPSARPNPIFKSVPPIRLPSPANAAIMTQQNVAGVISIPNFTRSFNTRGTRYRYTMMGNDPTRGGTTNIPARILAVSLRLQNADLKTSTIVPVHEFAEYSLQSPNFQPADYSSGNDIQFADAVQRAQFFSIMKPGWHTNLAPTRIVDKLTLDVPFYTTVQQSGHDVKVRTYFSGKADDGSTFVLLLESFFDQQIFNVVNDAVNNGDYQTNAMNIAIFPNTYLFAGVVDGQIVGCCVGGFHTYFTDGASPEHRWVFAYASYMSPGLFQGGTADVTALSHEISESFNDPFVNNQVHAWQFPGIPGSCQDNLETGDPLEVLENGVSPIHLRADGKPFTFHPQTEALWQWFAEKSHSSAIDGAYSYPDISALAEPATPFPQKYCPAQ
jgi:hypothetical protein